MNINNFEVHKLNRSKWYRFEISEVISGVFHIDASIDGNWQDIRIEANDLEVIKLDEHYKIRVEDVYKEIRIHDDLIEFIYGIGCISRIKTPKNFIKLIKSELDKIILKKELFELIKIK